MTSESDEARLLHADEEAGAPGTQSPQLASPWWRRVGTAAVGITAACAVVAAVRAPALSAGPAAAAPWRKTGFAGVAPTGNATSKVSSSTVNATATGNATHRADAHACNKAHADDEPGLFCWGVMFPSDHALIKSQFTGKAGMFACNDYAVISQEDKVIGKDECGNEFRTWQEDLPPVEKGVYGVNAETSSWLNVPIFLKCWGRVLESGKVWGQDFTVKLDPDAVFFPDRLRTTLKPHVGKPVFTTDCRYWAGDQVGKLFGSIEVLSKQAMGSYKTNVEACKNLPWQRWGEDMWMQKCMEASKVPAVGIFDGVSDGTCPLGGNLACSEQKVVFHPKKDAGQWWECWKQSVGQ
mmetsp:Transcript_123781/g.358040  ORF Transcript_123781/g.358040 Transcript_123781/m.358040 type:complete len:352 (+) Transcript_123781:74-1129(+)